MNLDSHIYIAGHNGLVGSAIWRNLSNSGFRNLIRASRTALDLLDQHAVESFFAKYRPEYVFLAAARVGGIKANNEFPADFIYQNLQIQANVIHSAWKHGVKKLLFLGSSCIYPNTHWDAITEDQLLRGGLEPTNEWYAVAKIAGIKMCQAYRKQYGFNAISVMPTNLYGPNDNYNADSSHVLPAMIRRFHDAKVSGQAEVECWGTGAPRREFLHVDDLASACNLLMEKYDSDQIINVGYSEDVPIRDLARMVADAVGYTGAITWNASKPDGTMRKLISSDRMHALGWCPLIHLSDGIKSTYRNFLSENV